MGAIETRADDRLLDAVRAEQIRVLFDGGVVGQAATLAIAVVLSGLLFWQHAISIPVAAAWVAALAAHTAAGVIVRTAYRRAHPPASDWRRWARRYMALNITSGLIWAVALPIVMPHGRFDLQLLLATVMASGTYNMIVAAGAYRPAFLTFVLPFPTLIVWFALQGDLMHIACAVMLTLWLPTVGALGWRYSESLGEAQELRFRNAALADDLRAQKYVAEQNALSKSRFLAAASHDLRQPVHALSMFVGALRGHKLPARSVTLVDHIVASVGALDGLFTSLLDISKLDAGVVEARLEPVALQPLVARICRDLAGEARAKGLRLTEAVTSLGVVSDPTHLERILRNLIGNAVRYTERGRVVVGARRIGRDRVRLEVWDTGPGVAEHQREAIFEEFYQVANAERDRTKGLGLGLAIVRRLVALLGHELSLQSRVRRGSVFGVTMARATVPATISPYAGPELFHEADAAVILVVDDEAPIRIGMSELLTSWGHRALAAGGGDEAIELLAQEGVKPDLIVADYRLRGEDGVQVIRRLQRAFGTHVPAILLTGDTAADRIREAQASGHPILHKPVSHGRLRAAVTNLLRRRATIQSAGAD